MLKEDCNILYYFILYHREDHCVVLWAFGPFPFDAFGWAKLVTSQDTKTQPIDHLTVQLTAWQCSSSSR